MKSRARAIICPPPCGQKAYRLDTRPTELPRIPRVRLYRCEGGHDFETAETIVGKIRASSRERTLVYRYTTKRGERQRKAQAGYAL